MPRSRAILVLRLTLIIQILLSLAVYVSFRNMFYVFLLFGSFSLVVGLIAGYLQSIQQKLYEECFGELKKIYKELDIENKATPSFKDISDVVSAISTQVEFYVNNLHDCITQADSLAKQLEIEKQGQLRALQEINEQAQNLKKFQLAVEKASDHILITDPEGIVVYTNLAAEEITGYKIDEILGKKAGTGWGGLMDKDYYKNMWSTIKDRKEVFKGEITNLKKNGNEYIADISIYPILSKEGEVAFFVSVQRDVTIAKEIDRMKTDFISLASHQLRAPLTAIRWGLEDLLSLKHGDLTEKQKEYTEDAYISTRRMIDLVTGLLNISRIESGRIIIDPSPTNLHDLINGVLDEVNIKIKERKQVVKLMIEPDVPIITIDPKLIRNVYMNLLTNANKYSPEGTDITIRIYKEGDQIISQVSDEGYGIPEKEQKSIFKRFFRASNIKKLDMDGTGLGLYLAKAVVETHNGVIWFDTSNKGTSFYFSLPLAGVEAKAGEVSLEN